MPCQQPCRVELVRSPLLTEGPVGSASNSEGLVSVVAAPGSARWPRSLGGAADEAAERVAGVTSAIATADAAMEPTAKRPEDADVSDMVSSVTAGYSGEEVVRNFDQK